ncbi:DNA repair and recombination protein RAD54B [Gracilariopsis chorda]|uniref:DNA repair and recombination protein RAD54B n=1 Tax=Gracilariopsis chorda TaxID=448386 RepID=A0A2V3J1Z5_9FLOR|nr:DNA repair and recombination protein RAD54B [Gracilariopsis chorda]|eukprot:PXF48375.1 DNA repair and recombination protein RAD54B [Gracilariopsis chorda]
MKRKMYFSVLYTKRSKKKHKSYLDGFIIVTNDRHVELQNEDGKKVTSERVGKLGGLKPGNTLEVSSWELEVQDHISEENFVSGRVFLKAAPQTISRRIPTKRRPFKPLKPKSMNCQNQNTGSTPLHDPLAPNAFILSPTQAKHSDSTIPVLLDPYLARRMRAHQKDGVMFLYRCVTGMLAVDDTTRQGAILADEMGLGKSLQAIALIWTLLKQGPTGFPLVKKAIVVCPASLVNNWVNEVKKWLGPERLEPIGVESGNSSFESKQGLAAFVNGNVKKLLIISYEMFRSYAEHLYRSGCGLVICDEGHRLKSSQGNKTIDALRNLPCRRRVILTGTPVQNDLDEFFAVCDFVNPGCLGTLQSFRNVFANPIIASKDSNATHSNQRIGEARAQELSRVTSTFVLRRTSDILEQYLPPKTETAIFCRLVPEQEKAYESEAKSRYTDIDSTRFSVALSAINYLRKICSHPALIAKDEDRQTDSFEYKGQCDGYFDVSHSSKLLIAMSICEACMSVNDRVIVVSNFTTTLDLVQDALTRRRVKYCRLDGSTNVSHRGDIVHKFNKGRLGDVFLLSAKAGGVGLNLIGANRLILFDPDWNPATDLQAMARVWRDGQKKPVFVYRLLCTGTIEEKIFQRQLFKGELKCAVDGDGDDGISPSGAFGGKEGNFSAEQLKDLFQYHRHLRFCDTLQVLENSQLLTKKDDRSDDNHEFDDKKRKPREDNTSLLKRFSQYRRIIEEESVEVENLVMCEEDDVLNTALNADLSTHGLVSYLYTNKSGNRHENELRNDIFDNDERYKLGERGMDTGVGTKRKLPKLFDSESEASSDEDVEKAMAMLNTEREKRYKQSKTMGRLSEGILVLDEKVPSGIANELNDRSTNQDIGAAPRTEENERNEKEWDAALDTLSVDYAESVGQENTGHDGSTR